MNPGRDLDALIAEKVFGCKPDNGRCGCPEETVTLHFPYSYTKRPHEGWDGPFRKQNEFPPYSTDISAAWEVMEKLISKYDVEINHLIYHGMGDPQGWFIKLNGDRVGFPHKTFPHEICLAALKAVGYENKS